MDEPFAALDFLTRAELQTQLLTIQQRLPRTIVLVTHQLEEALLLGQKIVVMHPDSSDLRVSTSPTCPIPATRTVRVCGS